MTEQPARSTRREAIKQTALAAGFVWTAPAIRSVRVLGASGTPAPPTSDTEPPAFTTYEFAGQLNGSFTLVVVPDTFFIRLSVTGELSALGICTFNADVFPFLPETGTCSLSNSDGTVSGFSPLVDDTFVDPILRLTGNFTIDNGTGLFEGAIGSLTMDLEFEFGPTTLGGGTVSGTFTVPN